MHPALKGLVVSTIHAFGVCWMKHLLSMDKYDKHNFIYGTF